MTTIITKDILDNIDVDFLNEASCLNFLGEDLPADTLNIPNMEDVRKLLKFLDKRRPRTIKDL